MLKKEDADYSELEFVKNNIQYTGYFEIKFGKKKLTKEQKSKSLNWRENIKNTNATPVIRLKNLKKSFQ